MMKFDKSQWTLPTVVGLAIPLLVMPLWNVVAGAWLFKVLDRGSAAFIGTLITTGLGFAIFAIVKWWEKKPLTEMGLRPQTPRTVIVALLACIVIPVVGTLMSLLILRVFNLSMPATQATENIRFFPVWLAVWIVVSSSIAEEFLYRGFPIERLGQLTGHIWWGGLITLVWFTLMHLPLGWTYTLSIVFPTSALVTLLYIWRRDLVANIAVHFVFNAPLIVASLVLGK